MDAHEHHRATTRQEIDGFPPNTVLAHLFHEGGILVYRKDAPLWSGSDESGWWLEGEQTITPRLIPEATLVVLHDPRLHKED